MALQVRIRPWRRLMPMWFLSPKAGTARSIRGDPSAAGLAFDPFTVQRASRSFWASLAGRAWQGELGRVLRPCLGNTSRLDLALLLVGGALLGSRHDGSINDLAAHGQKPRLAERRLEAGKQHLDRRLALDLSSGQRLAEGPDGVRVRHRVGQAQAQKAHEGQTVLDGELSALVREAVAGLQGENLEHEDVIERRSPALGAVGSWHRLLQIRPEQLEVDDLYNPL